MFFLDHKYLIYKSCLFPTQYRDILESLCQGWMVTPTWLRRGKNQPSSAPVSFLFPTCILQDILQDGTTKCTKGSPSIQHHCPHSNFNQKWFWMSLPSPTRMESLSKRHHLFNIVGLGFGIRTLLNQQWVLVWWWWGRGEKVYHRILCDGISPFQYYFVICEVQKKCTSKCACFTKLIDTLSRGTHL